MEDRRILSQNNKNKGLESEVALFFSEVRHPS